jgi:lysophospholipase L1-like esterase
MMASDGFHPGPPIYAAWADRVAQRVRESIRGHSHAPG